MINTERFSNKGLQTCRFILIYINFKVWNPAVLLVLGSEPSKFFSVFNTKVRNPGEYKIAFLHENILINHIK
jgi:hypothetical protein